MRLENTTSTILLLGVGSLSSVAFLRATDMLTNCVCVVAGLGWAAWWYQRTTFEAQVVSEMSVSQEAAVPASEPKPDNHASETKQADAVAKTPAAAEAAPPVFDAGPLVTDVKAALAEADQAVSVAITAFLKIAEEAQQISECAGEMMRWRQNTTPVIQETVSHLTERSGALTENLNEVIVAFQFHDGLSQRLQHTAASLEKFVALSSGASAASVPAYTHTPNPQPADYDPQSGLQNATLF